MVACLGYAKPIVVPQAKDDELNSRHLVGVDGPVLEVEGTAARCESAEFEQSPSTWNKRPKLRCAEVRCGTGDEEIRREPGLRIRHVNHSVYDK